MALRIYVVYGGTSNCHGTVSQEHDNEKVVELIEQHDNVESSQKSSHSLNLKSKCQLD